MLRYYTPTPAIDGAFFDLLASKKLTSEGINIKVQHVWGTWGVDDKGHHALRLTRDGLAGSPSLDTTWGWVFSLNSKEELASVAVPAIERVLAAAAAASACGCPDAPAFILCCVSDHKSHTTSYRLCLPALLVEEGGSSRDAAGARLVMLASAGDEFIAGSPPPGSLVRVADGIGSNARPPPAPLGWPARSALCLAAVIAGEPSVVTLVIERPPGSPVEAAIAVDFPRDAAIALLSPDSPWREVLRRVLNEGLSAAASLQEAVSSSDSLPVLSTTAPILPYPLTIPPLGNIHHGAAHGPAETDAAALARTAVRLHLELMKWRACPQFDIDKIMGLRVLIVGAGSIGCAISRILLGYGVTRQTFIDNATVGLSNVARQPLFSVEDASQGAKKATAAARAIVAAHPGAEAVGVVLDIPTPGRARQGEEAYAAHSAAITILRDLLVTADVVFLALDSREARWLPSVLAASLPPQTAPLVITAGVGFDAAVVVRHGVPHSNLGCFFCAGGDATPPRDSRTGAPQDALCTVTRAGIVPLAAALAAELAITTILHPSGAKAPHEAAKEGEMVDADYPSPFGAASHVTRARIRGPPSISAAGAPADPLCPACGPRVQTAFSLRGESFLIEAMTDEKTLTQLCSRDVENDSITTTTGSRVPLHASAIEGGWEVAL
jgi:hypothetical protein